MATDNPTSNDTRRQKYLEYQRQYYLQHRDARLKSIAQYKAEHHAETMAAAARYRAEHPEQVSASKKRWCVEHKEHLRQDRVRYAQEHRAERRDYQRRAQRIPSRRMKKLIYQAKKRAMKSGIELGDLSSLTASVPLRCLCCGVLFDYACEDAKRFPSLDRVDNSKGYTIENVRVICLKCNHRKSDATLSDLEKIVAYMRANLNPPERH